MSIITELEIKGVCVSSNLLIIEKKRYNNNRNAYRLDLGQEMKNHWMVFAVLFTVMLATLSPKLGAPGGLLHLEYASYIPLSYIYYSAGQRPLSYVSWRTLLVSVMHARIVSPALCIVAVTTFRDCLDYRVIEGVMLEAISGGCPWLALALCECEGVVAAVAADAATAALVVAAYSLQKCNTVPAVSALYHAAFAGISFYVGRRAARGGSGGGCGGMAESRVARNKMAALVLVYAESCRALRDAEGTLDFAVVMPVAVLVWWWALSMAALVSLYGRCGALAGPAHVVAAAGNKGWRMEMAGGACAVSGLGALPGVLLAPAQALVLAALRCPKH